MKSIQTALPRVVLLVALCISAVISFPAAYALSVEERLAALEAEVRALRSENKQLRQDLGVEGKSGMVIAKPAGKEPVLSINGLVQVQGEFGDRGDSRGQANDRFRLRRVRLGATGRFLEEFDFKVEGEYAGSGGTLTDGFLNWSHVTWANVKAGQFKAPFGYEFLSADPKLYTADRSLGTDRLTLNRQVGVQASGDFFDKQLSYAAGVFNGNGLNIATNDNENFNYVGRVSGVPWQGKLLGQPARWTGGVDAFSTKDTALALAADFGFSSNSFTGKRRGLGFDTQLSLGRFEIWTEWLGVYFRPTNRAPAAGFDADSWYVQASYFVVPKEIQAVARFETFDPNDTRLTNETDSWVFGTNWYLKADDLKLQLNYVHTRLPAGAPGQDALILRSQVIF